MKPPQKPWTMRDIMDEETRREIRQKTFFYNCKEPWEPGHHCMGKGKLHYMDVLSDEEDDDEDEVAHK
jgi:hypothetical protein